MKTTISTRALAAVAGLTVAAGGVALLASSAAANEGAIHARAEIAGPNGVSGWATFAEDVADLDCRQADRATRPQDQQRLARPQASSVLHAVQGRSVRVVEAGHDLEVDRGRHPSRSGGADRA